MFQVFLKDIVHRKARFLLSTIGISVLCSLILMLGGIMNGMKIQAQQYIRSTNADIWISAEGSGSAFIGFSLLIPEYLNFLTQVRGINSELISPLIFAQARPIIKGKAIRSVIIGYKTEKLGGPNKVIAGRMFTPSKFENYRPEDIPPAEAIVDEKLKVAIGEKISIGGKKIRVVGKVKSMMFLLDTPIFFMDIRTAQAVLLNNYLHVNMVAAKVDEQYSAEQIAKKLDGNGLIEVQSTEETIDEIIKVYVDEPMKAVQFLRAMLWFMAGLIVAMTTYVTTLEKKREIGILKAIGAENSFVILLSLKQVALSSLVGATFGVGLSYLFAKFAPIFVLIDPIEAIIVIVLSFVVCSIGGYFATSRVASIDPMIAFRSD